MISSMKKRSLLSDTNCKKLPRFTSPVSFAGRLSFCKAAMTLSSLMFFIALSLALSSVQRVVATDDANVAPAASDINSLSSFRRLEDLFRDEPPFYSRADGSRDCIANYDEDTDYFPFKVYPDFAVGFNVTYHNSYKRIEVPGANEVIYAYQCGAPEPETSGEDPSNDVIIVSIPLRKVGLSSTTYLPFVEYIGQRESVFHINSGSSDTGPCTQKLILQGHALSGFGVSESATTDLFDDFTHVSLGGDDIAYFGGNNNFLPRIRVTETTEVSALAQAEWTEFFALFFNREEAIQSVVSNIESRYTCTSELAEEAINAGAPKPKVAVIANLIGDFGSFGVFNGSNSQNCTTDNTFWCSIIPDAGGELVALTDGPNDYVFIGDLVDAMSEIDIIIYPDSNWDEVSPFGNPQFFTPEIADLMQDIPAIVNQRVYDIKQGDIANWFENRLAEPDVFIRDLVSIFIDPSPIGAHERQFLRNVFTEPANSHPNSPDDCDDVSEPLFTCWVNEGCDAVRGTRPEDFVIIPGLDTQPSYDQCIIESDNGGDSEPTASPTSPAFSASQQFSFVVAMAGTGIISVMMI